MVLDCGHANEGDVVRIIPRIIDNKVLVLCKICVNKYTKMDNKAFIMPSHYEKAEGFKEDTE